VDAAESIAGSIAGCHRAINGRIAYERMTAVARPRGNAIRHRLDVLEDSKEKIVLRERPHRGLGAIFCLCGLSMLSLLVWRKPQPGQGVLLTVMVGFGLAFLSFGVFCLVESTIGVTLESRELWIRRRIGWLKSDKRYPVEDVKRVFTRSSGKGSGLGVELAPGRKKNLTFFTEYADPAEQAGKLNHFIRTAAKRRAPQGGA
jgi:hypothetical protein